MAGPAGQAPQAGWPWLARLAVCWFLAIGAGLALAVALPALGGRVTDLANLLYAGARANLERKLQDFEDKSGIQLVIATVNSLEGNDVEPIANELFRAWKLGEKSKSNGVLFLIAPNQRKLRIEVGYGLEGTLTDAISKIIIANAVVPRFKANDYAGGIQRGVDDIITTLTADSADWQKRPNVRLEDKQSLLDAAMPFLIFMIFIFIVVSMMRSAGAGGGRRGGIGFIPTGGFGGGGGGFGGGFGGGGGFSGGGGSSGGGGASGDW